MRVQSLCLLVSFALGAFSGTAVASDKDLDELLDHAPQLSTVSATSGWYLRTDLSYHFESELSGAKYWLGEDQTAQHNFTWNTLAESGDVAIGVGYDVNDMFRGDITMGRIKTAFSGLGPCDDSFDADCVRSAASNLKLYSVLANAYVDFGTVIGITPYLGAGIGATYLQWDNFAVQNRCDDALCVDTSVAKHQGESDWRFTYALMAGLSYDVTRTTKIDFGYRYLAIEGGGMHHWDAASITSGFTGLQARDKGFSTHEIRIGLRFNL